MSIFSHHSRSSRRSHKAQGRGFTLIELLVVMAIMLIVTTFMLLRQSKFNSATLLRSLGYSVALSVRQAQVYGTSVLGTTTASCSGGSFTSGICYAKSYGVYFSCVNTTSCAGTSYVLFADLNNNGQYDSLEAVKTFTLGSGYIISDFGAVTGSITRSFKLSALTNMTVLFTRPNPDACFATSYSADACQNGAVPTETYSSAFVQVQSLNGDSTATRSINMTSTGQISVGSSGS